MPGGIIWAMKKPKRSKRGYVFSLEAAISILLFTLLIAATPQEKADSLKELASMQQANDLLRVWSASCPTEQEMALDLNGLLGARAELWKDNRKIASANATTNSIATEGTLVDCGLAETKVRIAAYYD